MKTAATLLLLVLLGGCHDEPPDAPSSCAPCPVCPATAAVVTTPVCHTALSYHLDIFSGRMVLGPTTVCR